VPAESIAVPPTFPACFTVVRGGSIHDDPELGAHWNLVHGSQEYTYHRPIRVGDVLRCTPWVVDIKPRGRMELLTLQVDCETDGGVPVLESRGVIIFFTPEGT
jgi:acyl dehydratase